jgi:hypothetical protein
MTMKLALAQPPDRTASSNLPGRWSSLSADARSADYNRCEQWFESMPGSQFSFDQPTFPGALRHHKIELRQFSSFESMVQCRVERR